MSRIRRCGVVLVCLVSLVATQRVFSQAPNGPRSQITRAEIEAAIVEGDKILASPGYSGRIKDMKRRELSLLRYRLAEGDFQQGDQILLTVQNETALSGTFVVGPGRVLSVPTVGDIPLKGVLRAEAQDYLTAQIRRFVKEPVVRAETSMRLSILGAVGKPGFYPVGSGVTIGDAIMAAGGLVGSIDPSKTRIEREGSEIVSKEGFAKALQDGKTLDQLSLRAGDEILVGGDRVVKAKQSFLMVALPVFTGLLSLTYLITR